MGNLYLHLFSPRPYILPSSLYLSIFTVFHYLTSIFHSSFPIPDLSIYLSIYLFIYLSIYLSIYLYLYEHLDLHVVLGVPVVGVVGAEGVVPLGGVTYLNTGYLRSLKYILK